MAKVTKKEKMLFLKHSKKWYHTIDLGDGVITNGDPGNNRFKWDMMKTHIPKDCVNMTFGDFGSAEGYFSLKMLQRGCSKAVLFEKISTTVKKIHFVMKCYSLTNYRVASSNLEHVISAEELSWKSNVYDYTFALAIYHWLKDPIRFLKMLSVITKRKCFFEIKVNDRDRFGLRTERSNGIKWDFGHDLFVNLAHSNGFGVVKLLGDYVTRFGSHRALYVLGKVKK